MEEDSMEIGVVMPPPGFLASSSSGDEPPAAQQQEAPDLKALHDRVKSNSRSYEAHLALVTALRGEVQRASDREQQQRHLAALRAAREAFSQAFPLSPELWSDWIQEEAAGGMAGVRQLYLRAFKDYQCAQLRPGYLSMLEEMCTEEVGTQVEVVESALPHLRCVLALR
jgi:hypothetical protein